MNINHESGFFLVYKGLQGFMKLWKTDKKTKKIAKILLTEKNVAKMWQNFDLAFEK